MGQDRRFQRLWFATVASNLGDGLVLAAFPLLAAGLTRDPIAISALTLAAGLPWLLLGPLSGAVVDRFDRRRLMYVFDMVRAGVVGALAVSVAMGVESLAILYAVVFLIGSGETVVDVSSQAILPSLVPKDRLDSANGRLFSTMTIANRFIGPPLGGFLFGLGALVPVTADAISFAVAALVVAGIAGSYRPAATDGAGPAKTMWASVVEGMRWLWSNRPIRTFAIGAASLNVGILAGESILVLYAQEQLGLDAVGFGALFLATAAGYSAGSFLAPALTRRVSRLALIASALAGVGLCLVLIGLAPHWAVAATGLAGIGLASGLWDVIAVSYRQAAVPDALLGRTMAAYRVIAHGSIPIGALLGGVVAAVAGNRAAFIAGALVTGGFAPFVVSRLRGVELDPGRALG
ncbi:MAG TPA: MFS transporter [Acidimicrobiia bacterium]|jgi:MFS family permease|nr:MFS transporter [Acidimicrobiia bacterium]